MPHRLLLVLIITAMVLIGCKIFGPEFGPAVERIGAALGIAAFIEPPDSEPSPIAVPTLGSGSYPPADYVGSSGSTQSGNGWNNNNDGTSSNP